MSDNKNEFLRFDNDAGNDSMKVKFNGNYFKTPSVIAIKGMQDITAPVTFDNDQQKKAYMEDFLNHMDASISSSAIDDDRRFLVGQNAVDSSLPLTNFDLNDLSGKSDVDLTVMLTLCLIAGYRVKTAFQSDEDLNEPLKVTVNMTTALPISEGKQPNKIAQYRDRYLGSSHVVTFHNFKDPITVQIRFNKVYVGLEGELAQLAIMNAIKNDDPLGKSILQQLKSNYPKVASKLNKQVLLSLIKNCLGVDVGGKTTDYSVILNGKTNLNASNSMLQGYDNVLERARLFLQTKQYNFDSISQLQNYLNSAQTDLFGNAKETVLKVIDDEAATYCDQIVSHTSSIVRQIGSSLLLSFVHGGGSIALADSQLQSKLSQKLSSFNAGNDVPVVWIDSKYAQNLNLMGLSIVQTALSNNN